MKRYLPELEPLGVPAMDSRVVRFNWGYERSELKAQAERGAFLFKLVGGPIGLFSSDIIQSFIPGSEARKSYLEFRKNIYNKRASYQAKAESSIAEFLEVPVIKEQLENEGTTELSHRNTQTMYYEDRGAREIGPLEHIRVTRLRDDNDQPVTEFDITTINRWEDTGGIQTRVLFFAEQADDGTQVISNAFVHNRSSDSRVHPIDEYVHIGPVAPQADVYDHISLTIGPLASILQYGHSQHVVEFTDPAQPTQ